MVPLNRVSEHSSMCRTLWDSAPFDEFFYLQIDKQEFSKPPLASDFYDEK